MVRHYVVVYLGKLLFVLLCGLCVCLCSPALSKPNLFGAQDKPSSKKASPEYGDKKGEFAVVISDDAPFGREVLEELARQGVTRDTLKKTLSQYIIQKDIPPELRKKKGLKFYLRIDRGVEGADDDCLTPTHTILVDLKLVQLSSELQILRQEVFPRLFWETQYNALSTHRSTLRAEVLQVVNAVGQILQSNLSKLSDNVIQPKGLTLNLRRKEYKFPLHSVRS